MAQSVGRQVGLYAAFLHHNVVVGVLAFWNVLVRNVRYGEQNICHVLLGFVHYLLNSLVGRLQLGYLCFDALGFVFLALLHQAANLGRQLLLLLLVGIELLLSLAA